MSKKSVDDYLTDGIYGVRLPKEEERRRFLGTLEERIVIALTTGQVVTDSGLKKLEEAMQSHPKARLIINGHVSYRFLKEEKELAAKYNIPYTTITNEEFKTDIGAVLTYDHAINMENIFVELEPEPAEEPSKEENDSGFISKLKKWFS
ncbi:YueI family protein [Oceanobacillus sp. CAU 1775]